MSKNIFIQIKSNSGNNWQEWVKQIKSWEWVDRAWTCSGEWDWLLKVDAKNIANWDELKD